MIMYNIICFYYYFYYLFIIIIYYYYYYLFIISEYNTSDNAPPNNAMDIFVAFCSITYVYLHATIIIMNVLENKLMI